MVSYRSSSLILCHGRAGLEALDVGSQYLGWVDRPFDWDHDSEPSEVLLGQFAPAVARMRALDPVLTELVRLLGAAAHNCRLCKSLRDGDALDAGGSETLYDEISRFENSAAFDHRAKAALRYADALIWSPAHLAVDDAVEVRSRFSEAEAVELTFDIIRYHTRLRWPWVPMPPEWNPEPSGI